MKREYVCEVTHPGSGTPVSLWPLVLIICVHSNVHLVALRWTCCPRSPAVVESERFQQRVAHRTGPVRRATRSSKRSLSITAGDRGQHVQRSLRPGASVFNEPHSSKEQMNPSDSLTEGGAAVTPASLWPLAFVLGMQLPRTSRWIALGPCILYNSCTSTLSDS